LEFAAETSNIPNLEILNERRLPMENDLEVTIMQLIIYSGEARSLAIQAIRVARKGEFEEAKKLISECQEKMVEAHKFQTELIFSETSGNKVPISLLMIHAQDHVMNAMTMKDIVVEVIEILIESKSF